MLKDIPVKKVENLAFAIVPRKVGEDDFEYFWDCYLLNLKKEPIRSVLVNSKGYGQLEGEHRKTSTLRYFYEEISGETAVKIEPIPLELLKMSNEYWVSFSFGNYLYDKKYVFVQGSLVESNLVDLPILDRKGVMIR